MERFDEETEERKEEIEKEMKERKEKEKRWEREKAERNKRFDMLIAEIRHLTRGRREDENSEN